MSNSNITRPERFRIAAPATGGNNPATESVLTHYLELAVHFRRFIAMMTLAAAVVATVLAVFQLTTNPLYRASAKVTIQPTDAELRFTQVYVRSSTYDSANVVTQSHMEYLRSREIAQRAFDTLNAQAGGAPQPPEPGFVERVASGLKLAVRSTIRRLNSGTFIPVTGEEAIIGAIQESIEINIIESSFIMEIAVYWDDPEIAAQIANVLASVYQDRTMEQSAAATAELVSFLEGERKGAEKMIYDLKAQRDELRGQWGVVDYDVERSDLITRAAEERANLASDKAQLRRTEAKIDAFAPLETGDRRTGLDDITEEELSLARLDAVSQRQGVAEREAILANINRQLRRYVSYEEPLTEIDDAISREDTRLADIEERLLTTRMGQTESIERLRVIDQATPPLYPDSPKVLKQLALGAAAGLVLAIMAILARDLLVQRLVTRADVAEATGLKVLQSRRLRPGAPYLGWSTFEAGGTILVLDVLDEKRARRVAVNVLKSSPVSDVSCGLLPRVRLEGYINDDVNTVVVTMGADEVVGADLAEDLGHLRAILPRADMAVYLMETEDSAPATPKPDARLELARKIAERKAAAAAS